MMHKCSLCGKPCSSYYEEITDVIREVFGTSTSGTLGKDNVIDGLFTIADAIHCLTDEMRRFHETKHRTIMFAPKERDE